ncbi:Cyclin-dependent kinase inhibitor family protein, putative isoform 2 [Hibiscus syriacus]|uniref:Cyclin-dependent kinase inhibitor n=1 Tax=Hibiscus syriacus TaxID=106335 RepID=A0A6A3AQ17_HIBSY|nr:cyclin-dependent kinase inhibitor 7-like isoform X2 [Hibiscus syriacus]KAE8704982.1 Cyclin-dependent kinase inhibitor family protein, putative isoform 2 [Hibiscus syriacus]
MEVANVVVRTPAMVPVATGTVQKKRRRFNDDNDGEEAEFRVASSTTSYIQLRGQRILVDHHRGYRNQCLGSNSDHDDDVSCSSTSFSSCEKRNIELPDLEDESIEDETSTHFSSRDRREKTPSAEAEDMDSRSRPSERRSTVVKMPTEAELEEFFSVAEEKLQNHFAEKYNYDIFKDEPLEGRCKWIRLKP